MNLNQEFECLPSQSKLKLSRIYNSHYSGSHCWNYSGVMFQQLVNSYNVNLRVMFELPDSTHCWLIEALSGYKHARQQIYSRFVKFVNSLYNNKRIIVKSLFDSVSHDVRSQVGANMKKVLIDTGIPIIPGWTRPSDLQHYQVYKVPVGQEWRLGLLESLLELRGDNWAVLFNEEEEDEEEIEENDLKMMIVEVCTT